MPSLIKKIIPKSSRAVKRDQLRRAAAFGGKVQIDHIHFVEDFRKECFLKQMTLEKNRMQTDLRMDEIRRELTQLHSQSQEFLRDVEKLDRDIENERFRRQYQMYGSNDQLFFREPLYSSDPEFSHPLETSSNASEEFSSDLNVFRPGTALSEGTKRLSIESDSDTDEYTFKRAYKFPSERPIRRHFCGLKPAKPAAQDTFSEQVFAAVRDTITHL